jgi:hypothetical protein
MGFSDSSRLELLIVVLVLRNSYVCLIKPSIQPRTLRTPRHAGPGSSGQSRTRRHRHLPSQKCANDHHPIRYRMSSRRETTNKKQIRLQKFNECTMMLRKTRNNATMRSAQRPIKSSRNVSDIRAVTHIFHLHGTPSDPAQSEPRTPKILIESPDSGVHQFSERYLRSLHNWSFESDCRYKSAVPKSNRSRYCLFKPTVHSESR